MSRKEEAIKHQEKALDHEASVWVAASAGSGKTRVLTNRVLKLLLKGAWPERILCLTYTKAAAAEMRNRLNATLRGWVIMDDNSLQKEIGDASVSRARSLFARVLETPGGMRIETIHSFAQSLLKRFPLEAGITPHFEVMEEEESKAALKEAADMALREFTQEFSFIASRCSEGRFRGIIKDLTARPEKLEAIKEFNAPALAEYLGADPNLDQDELLEQFIAASDKPKLKELAAGLLASKSKTDKEKGEKILSWLDSSQKDIDLYQSVFLTKENEPRKDLATKSLLKEKPWLQEVLNQELGRVLLYGYQSKTQEVFFASRALWRVGAGILGNYQGLKARKARLDYNDLINLALKLLRDPGAAWVLYKLDGGIDHLLIDEAQDTSPAQWEIAKILADEFFSGFSARENTRTLFVVGDVKQSIYGFQGAEPRKYAQMQAEFRAKAQNSLQKWQDAPLYYSFRSVQAVLDVVDAVFKETMAQEGIALEGEYHPHIATREGAGGLIEIWPLIEPEPKLAAEPWLPSVELIRRENPAQLLARAIAAKIKEMVGKEELPSQGRPIREGDILILLRRRGDLAGLLSQELKEQGLNVAGSDRMVLGKELVIKDLLALGQFCLQPWDDLNLACLLKSPLFGLGEEELFALAHKRKGHLWNELEKKPEIQSQLQEFLRQSAILSPFDFFSRVLGSWGGKKKLIASLGINVIEAIEELLNLCRKYSQHNPPSLLGFIQWFQNSQAEIRRDMEEAGSAIRIMTVHGAKGLQAPIVFLPDTIMSQNPGGNNRPKLFWPEEVPILLWAPMAKDMTPPVIRLDAAAVQKEWAEYWRLLYVAMTRAEDRLYICGYGKENSKDEGWYKLIYSRLQALGQELEDGKIRFACEQKIRTDSTQILQEEAIFSILPLWLQEKPPIEPTPPRPLTPSKGEEVMAAPVSGLAGSRRKGVLAHKLLQYLPEYSSGEWLSKGELFLRQNALDWPEIERHKLILQIINIMQHDDYKHIFEKNSRAEVPITGIWNNHIVSGRVDRLLIDHKEILIIDYKSGASPSSLLTIPQPYIDQMQAYMGILTQIWPKLSARAFLLWIEEPKIFEITSKISR